MTRAIAASESEITEVRAAVLLNSCSLCLNPPSRMDSPRTSRMLPMMDPVIEAFTTLVSPLESAMAAMISSAALPKVAFNSPPSPSPTRAASSSVARPIQPATGMIASPEQTKSAVGLTWPGQKRSANAIGAKIRSQFKDGFILINTARASQGCSTIRIGACLANSDACARRDSEKSNCGRAVVAAGQSSRQSFEVITFYTPDESALELPDPAQCSEFTRRAVWIDLCEPTPEEEQVLEAALGLEIPTREEMQAIELSSRLCLYKEGNVLYLTATVLVKAQIERPESAAVTFILMPEQLVTLRYETPRAFQAFRARREANLTSYRTSYDILAGLIDAIIERIADILE